jgi:hypothetical protein
VSHQSAEVILAVYDVQKCRRAPPPGQQNAAGATEVFYQFNVKNFSSIPAAWGFEVIDFSDLM